MCIGKKTLNQTRRSNDPPEPKSKTFSLQSKGLIRPKASHPPKKKRNGSKGLPFRVCGLLAPQCGQVFPGRLTPSYSINSPHFSHGSFKSFVSWITPTSTQASSRDSMPCRWATSPQLDKLQPFVFFSNRLREQLSRTKLRSFSRGIFRT